MKQWVAVGLTGWALSACATGADEQPVSTGAATGVCETRTLVIDEGPSGVLLLNGQPADLERVRQAARQIAQTCQDYRTQATITATFGRALGNEVDAILSEELPGIQIEPLLRVSGGGLVDFRVAPEPYDFPDATACQSMRINLVVEDDRVLMNNFRVSEDVVRVHARNKAHVCGNEVQEVAFGRFDPASDVVARLERALREELPRLDLASWDRTGDRWTYAGSGSAQPRRIQDRCDAVAFNIVVSGDETLELNGGVIDLETLRSEARYKANVCRGAVPGGTYEGPNHVTVIASMVWPVLREELPNLELDMSHRGP